MKIFIPLFTSENMNFRHATGKGPKRITNEIPYLEDCILSNLDINAIMMLL